jgi:hypothetical protein
MSSYDPEYEAYHQEIRDLHDTLKGEKRDISETKEERQRGGKPMRDYTETPTERYYRKEKERQRRGNTSPRRRRGHTETQTSPRRGHTETPTERYHRKEKERLKELERDPMKNVHRARKLDKIHQDMVKEREERERTNETAEAPNEEDPLLKKPQMANMYDLLTQLHQCA